MKRPRFSAGFALASLAFLCAAAVQDGRGGVDVLFAPTGGKRLLEGRISREIGEAKRDIRVAIYQFTSVDLAQELASAARRGVDVRVLVDGVQSAQGGRYGEALRILAEAKVPVRKVYPEGLGAKDRKRSEATRPKFHHKFCAIDGRTVIAGSYNWTVLADEENHENLLVIASKEAAGKYVERFEEIWKNTEITEQP